MASSVCFSCVNSIVSPSTSTAPIRNPRPSLISLKPSAARCVSVKATESDKKPKVNSLVCPQCEGNGAIVCKQCKGTAVNSADHFNGQFKAGALCWLCRGKREILCGDCNGAGFLGGFMSTFDE